MTGAGDRDRKIQFQRASPETDDHGGETKFWERHCDAWALVLFGSGVERREAAQQGGAQVATFRVLSNSLTRAVSIADRIVFGGNWDIIAIAPIGRSEIDFTGVRAA